MLVLEPDYHRFATNVLELRLHFCHLGITTSRSTTIFGTMTWLKRSSPLIILALALTLGPALNISAQPSQSGSSSFGSQLKKAFTPPPRGIPNNRQGGATRNPESCFIDTRFLMALVPEKGGETAAEYPTVFWYMPRMSAQNAPAPEIEFTLSEVINKDNDKQIYSAKYPLTKYADGSIGTPGIMSLKLARPLEVGPEYKWELRVKCNSLDSDRSQDQFVEGSLKRVAENPDLKLSVQQATPEDRVILYARANLWYELLANMVALRRDRPNDPALTDAWNNLFAAVNLNDVSIQSRSQGTRNTTNSN